MPEEPTPTPAPEPTPTPEPTPAPAPEPTPEPTPPADPGAIDFHTVIGPDGKLLDGWKESLPEELRHEQALDMIVDFPGAIKQTVNAQKMIGKNKIALPGENATQAEVDAFQVALGRPETIEGYEVTLPEDIKEYFDEGLVKSAKEMVFSKGGSQDLLNSLFAFREQEIRAGIADAEATEKREFEEAERIITAQAGEALDDQKHLADVLIANNVPEKIDMPDGTTITGEEYREKLLEVLNDNPFRPYVFNLLANIQREHFEQGDGVPAGEGGAPGAMTPPMMGAKANELQETPGYMNGELKNTNPEKYKRLTAEITELYNKIEKAKQAAQVSG